MFDLFQILFLSLIGWLSLQISHIEIFLSHTKTLDWVLFCTDLDKPRAQKEAKRWNTKEIKWPVLENSTVV